MSATIFGRMTRGRSKAAKQPEPDKTEQDKTARSGTGQQSRQAVLGNGIKPLTEGGKAYWRHMDLEAMDRNQWEALCDGCGKCCLNKLQDDDGGPVDFTNVACHLLDVKSGRCSDYVDRWESVPDCVQLTAKMLYRTTWLPRTCAYRLLREGKDLPEWHPLITGDPESVHKAGMSVRGRCISERDAGPLEHNLVDWDDL